MRGAYWATGQSCPHFVLGMTRVIRNPKSGVESPYTKTPHTYYGPLCHGWQDTWYSCCVSGFGPIRYPESQQLWPSGAHDLSGSVSDTNSRTIVLWRPKICIYSTERVDELQLFKFRNSCLMTSITQAQSFPASKLVWEQLWRGPYRIDRTGSLYRVVAADTYRC